MTNESLLNGDVVQSGLADNATATASKAAIQAQRIFVCGVEADYSATVAAIKTITLKFGTVTKFIIRWPFSLGPFLWAFPAIPKSIPNEAASIELEASGTGGVTGRVAMFFFLN